MKNNKLVRKIVCAINDACDVWDMHCREESGTFDITEKYSTMKSRKLSTGLTFPYTNRKVLYVSSDGRPEVEHFHIFETISEALIIDIHSGYGIRLGYHASKEQVILAVGKLLGIRSVKVNFGWLASKYTVKTRKTE
jgi:hypothetical protein